MPTHSTIFWNPLDYILKLGVCEWWKKGLIEKCQDIDPAEGENSHHH